ncbi:serine O-acetyltransferase [Buchnera aphidicola (Melanaphis sacchari)]|uniref:Serine acetyltransferase n=1 Tax=Buchnera aphidicola (Melanaphis sacchari) TaxID=2173854 RepID=A0A2U8DGX8_9GAMM|nr:serine O-acetyltransferase [Buchnera aphidicola]AWH90705.1 serine O-acetyltransferase [Buchnera aphidicola (Melanaphis sacchari)]
MCFSEAVKVWNNILHEANISIEKEPILFNFYQKNILRHHNLNHSLSYILANKLANSMVSKVEMRSIFNKIYLDNSSILNSVIKDIKAILQKDPVVNNYLIPFLYLKGFHALEAYRLSNYLWNKKKYDLSIYLQSRISTVFSVDIHPAAYIGSGIMLDHATGIVIGEGVVIEDEVSILHSVTLGGTGKINGKNRHPTIRKKVSIGAGAKILGNIEVGLASKIGAGAVVIKNVPPNVTVAGVPAKIVNKLHDKNINFFEKNKKNSVLCMEFFQHGDGI